MVKYIDPADQKYATTDFEDELKEDEVKVKDFEVNDPAGDYASPFPNSVHRLEEIIRANNENITISRIRQGEQITEEELKSLEDILFEGIDKTSIENELGGSLNLVEFIISLMGLSANSVDKAFAKFINEYQLSSVQIQFLDTIKLFLTKNGKIDSLKLYDAPFKNFHSLGVDGVFNDEQADKIFKIIEDVNKHGNSA
ncbi:type I restriction-modification enzyme R subunit C-terminal domain-containing protein [Crocinitomix algicola]|uniref:type I restriction-modification enzyme R subunit C-terminal domain-containing protein n=1 Tax=Crocinitomix algicola TaxID=1740263 RepID=UPI0008732AD6|nr:type I restriction-modification enzyme R subunit C-terminal domain-containing protein [Crocinitomix algicola]